MTSRSHLLGTAFSLLSVLVTAGPAEAGPVTLSFTGEVTTISGLPPGQLAQVMLGDLFQAQLQLDPRNASPFMNGDLLDFPGAVAGDSLQLMLPAFGVLSEGALGSLRSRDSVVGMTDFVSIAFQFARPSSSSAELFQVELLFEDLSGTLFDSGAGLLLPTDLTQFDRAELRIFPIDPATGRVTGGGVFATVRTAAASVPEPAAAASSGLGLLALAWLRRRRPARRLAS